LGLQTSSIANGKPFSTKYWDGIGICLLTHMRCSEMGKWGKQPTSPRLRSGSQISLVSHEIHLFWLVLYPMFVGYIYIYTYIHIYIYTYIYTDVSPICSQLFLALLNHVESPWKFQQNVNTWFIAIWWYHLISPKRRVNTAIDPDLLPNFSNNS